MNIMKPILLFVILTLFLSGCAVNKGTVKRLTVPAKHEKVFLSPLVNNSAVEVLEGWPQDSAQKSILLGYFAEIHEDLFIEFRRCEKYGLYEVVTDSLEATVHVTVKLSPHTFESDTLKIPLEIFVIHSPLRERLSYELTASGTFQRSGNGNNKPPYHYIGLMLSDLKHTFPYRKVVSYFYPENYYEK